MGGERDFFLALCDLSSGLTFFWERWWCFGIPAGVSSSRAEIYPFMMSFALSFSSIVSSLFSGRVHQTSYH